MSFKLAHLSDLHLPPMPKVRPWELCNKRIMGFLSWQWRRRHHHRIEVLDAMIERLELVEPDHIVITGDIVNIGLLAEFKQSALWLERLERIAPLSLIPGNHDAYTAESVQGWHHWNRWTHGGFPFAHNAGPLRLIGLSSAVPSGPGRATGRLGAVQLSATDQLLRAHDPTRWTVILVHHPPFEGASLPRKSLTDAAAFRDILARHEVDFVLSGHEHKDQRSTLPTAGGQAQTITAPSLSIEMADPARTGGFNLLSFEQRDGHERDGVARFEQWRYDQGRKNTAHRDYGVFQRKRGVWRLSEPLTGATSG